MSPGCCSTKKDDIESCCGPLTTSCPEGDSCCGDDGDSCCDKDSVPSGRSLKLHTCSSQEELCDEKCITTAAAFECARTCSGGHDPNDVNNGQNACDREANNPTSACSAHLSKAFEQYISYLDTARCICRGVLEGGLPAVHCSVSQKKQAQGDQLATNAAPQEKSGCCSAKSAVIKPAQQAKSGCCSSKDVAASTAQREKSSCCSGESASAKLAQQEKSSCCSGQTVAKKSNCCSSENAASNLVAEKKPNYCSSKSVPKNTVQQQKKSSCCSSQDTAISSSPKKPCSKVSGPIDRKERDIEKDAGPEHVAIGVDGMTCTGCSDKLERILKAAPGVSNVRVNFVMGNADFSFDSAFGDVNEMIRGVERATGFKCTRSAGGDQYIDVLASGTAAKLLMDIADPGVSDVAVLDKKTVRISYDPIAIGARDLLESISDRCGGLAPPAVDASMSSGRKSMYSLLIKTIIAAILTIPVIVLAWGDTLVDEKTKAYVSVVLATLVQLIAVPVFYLPAIKGVIYDRSLEMDMLVTVSITAAYVYSIVAFGFHMANRPLETSEFFETSTLLITLVLLGRLIAAIARMRAVAAVSFRSLQSSTAILVEAEKEREIDTRLLQYGDSFKVLAHSHIPTDGLVVHGSSEVDESMLTGESVPVTKQPGHHIIAGTMNGTGVLHAQLRRLPGKNTVTDIAELVEEATNSKPRIQDLADRVAGWFVPVVILIAVVVTIVWIVISFKVRNEPANKAIANAITYAVAVLAISCPCALGLAVPMVLVVAGGIAARGGVVIKSAECTAKAYKVTDVVFDKTGTLTESDLDVLAEEFFASDRDEAIAIAKALVAGNKHPVSAAVAKYLEKKLTKPAPIGDVRVIPGAGVECSSRGAVFQAGNPHWTHNENLPAVTRFFQDGMTTLLITRDAVPLALFGLRASLRPEAAAIVSKLHRRNITTHLVSGDQTYAVGSIATSVGIASTNVAAQRTPAQKRDYVASLMDQKKIVMFCGDGTNDAVAIAQADIGVQLGGSLSSSDVTRGAADIVLLAGLNGITFLLDVSQAAFRRMAFNFIWSGVYNVVAILFAAGAFVNVRVEPAYAGLGEMVSVLPVIIAAMTMFLLKQKQDA